MKLTPWGVFMIVGNCSDLVPFYPLTCHKGPQEVCEDLQMPTKCMWLTFWEHIGEKPKSEWVKSEWPQVQSRWHRHFPRKTGHVCSNRRRCQAWILEKEAQSRPCPILFLPGTIPDLRPHIQALSPCPLQNNCSSAILRLRMVTMALDLESRPWEPAWAIWVENSRPPVRRGPKPGPLKHKFKARTLLPRSICGSSLRSECLLESIQHWLKGRDTCLQKYSRL